MTSSGRIAGDSRRGTAGSDLELQGLTAGMDLLNRDGARAGLLAGFLSESLAMDERRSEVRGSSVHVGAYGQWTMGSVALRGVAGFSQAHSDAERRVAFGDTVRMAQSSFETTDTVVSVEARFGAVGTSRVRMQPVMSLGRYTTHREGFEETGAGEVGLTVKAYDAAWVRGRVGLELGPATPGESGLKWHGRLTYVHDFSVAEREAAARFNGAPDGRFTVAGTPVESSGFEVELGASGKVQERFAWGLSYAGEFRGDGDSHVLQASVGISF